MQDNGLTCTDTSSLENKKLLKKNKKMDYMRNGERVEVCWEKARRGEIVGGHKHQAAQGHHMQARYSSACVYSSKHGKLMKLLPSKYVV